MMLVDTVKADMGEQGDDGTPDRRIVSVWLPRFATDWLLRRNPGWQGRPLVVIAGERGRHLVTALDSLAERAGVTPGMSLADARALEPGLRVIEADPLAKRQALTALAGWHGRFTPWVVEDGGDGLILDVTGCAHLVGGEAVLLDKILGDLNRLGYAAQAALADTVGAAWAMARYDARHRAVGRHFVGDRVVPPGAQGQALTPLPVAALRLSSGVAAGLRRLGLKRIGDLYAVPRSSLTARFGTDPVTRLDQALGRVAEPVSPHQPVADYRARRAFAEPIRAPEQIAATTRGLLDALCRDLDGAGQGARRLVLNTYRVDGRVLTLEVGTARPSRNPKHLIRLFIDRIGTLDPGFGVEVVTLAAPVVEACRERQQDLPATGLLSGGKGGCPADALASAEAAAELVDRLSTRLGRRAVFRLDPVATHWPEYAQAARAPLEPSAGPGGWPDAAPRPVRLLPIPVPVEVAAPIPDDPPVLFRWNGQVHRIRRADGPERVEAEWWHDGVYRPPRDYYQVEDTVGTRFWLFRDGLWRDGAEPPSWYLHGIFG